MEYRLHASLCFTLREMNWTKGWLAVFLIGSALQADAQSTSTNGTQTNQPANAWLRTPMPYSSTTVGVSQTARADRDQYFDNGFGVPFALKPDTAPLAHIAARPVRPGYF